jgi:rubrerythrin
VSVRITRASFLALAASAAAAPRAWGDIRDDLRVLAYALTVEYVQSALYREALQTVPGLDGGARTLIEEIRDHEIEHVDALRATIADAGGRAADRPRVDFGVALESRDGFLRLANALEDAGVSAYNGAAPAFENEDFVAVFASIAQTEARHAALVRLLRGRPPAPLALDKASPEHAVRELYGRYVAG